MPMLYGTISGAVIVLVALLASPETKGMDLSADGRLLYVSSRWAGKMTVIDTSTRAVVRQVKVGKSPHGVWTLDHAAR